MSMPVKRWNVTLASWQMQNIILHAATAEKAVAMAEELWCEDGDRFSYKDGGIDGISAEEVEP